ncbi:hypothetical protein BD779DRAFT_1433441 [Infundibulicybe gibba]|nr:hypothetical protein BD779DRAFT_1433441 [Infundibulicybe gibba]
MATRTKILQLALPLIRTHGFTREALANSVLSLPPSEGYTKPLSDSSVSALFGQGELAERTLIDAWLGEGIKHMKQDPSHPKTLKQALRARLDYNLPVIHQLPRAFASLASPQLFFPQLNPVPALTHVMNIADEACHITGTPPYSPGELSWYAKRASLAAIYGAAELHQLTSPATAPDFLESLFETDATIKSSVDEVSVFAAYITKSWMGIAKSSGIF